jgi:hypothetical protein
MPEELGEQRNRAKAAQVEQGVLAFVQKAPEAGFVLPGDH